MATTPSLLATTSPQAIGRSQAGWCLTSRKRSERQRSDPELRGTKGLDCFVASGRAILPYVEDDTGDDEHCRHRQRLRERFRGCPFGGFLHVQLPRLGHDLSSRETRASNGL